MCSCPTLAVPTIFPRSGVLDAQTEDSSPVADVGYAALVWFDDVYSVEPRILVPGDRLRVVWGGVYELVSGALDLGAQVQGLPVAGGIVGSVLGSGAWRIVAELTVGAASCRVSFGAGVGTASVNATIPPVAVDLDAAAVVRAGVRFTVADPGNNATQTYRSVELLAGRVA